MSTHKTAIWLSSIILTVLVYHGHAFYISDHTQSVSARFSLTTNTIQLTLEGTTPIINFANTNNQFGTLIHVATPTTYHHVANKYYVDQQISNIPPATFTSVPTPTLDENPANKYYVDQQINQLQSQITMLMEASCNSQFICYMG